MRWAPRNVEVSFAEGHMLNSNQSSPECQFLAEVGRDGIAQLSTFSWDRPLDSHFCHV